MIVLFQVVFQFIYSTSTLSCAVLTNNSHSSGETTALFLKSLLLNNTKFMFLYTKVTHLW